jgi:hypothetical protein
VSGCTRQDSSGCTHILYLKINQFKVDVNSIARVQELNVKNEMARAIVLTSSEETVKYPQ